jgi:hypothetical protein
MSKTPFTAGWLPHLESVRVRIMPEFHPVVDRSCFLGQASIAGPVQQDGHGTFRSATRLVTFCRFPAPVKSGLVVSEGRESSLSTTVILSEETSDCLATADRRHIIHPFCAGPATAPAPYGHATSG